MEVNMGGNMAGTGNVEGKLLNRSVFKSKEHKRETTRTDNDVKQECDMCPLDFQCVYG